jgi:hypothetical protein
MVLDGCRLGTYRLSINLAHSVLPLRNHCAALVELHHSCLPTYVAKIPRFIKFAVQLRVRTWSFELGF